MSVYQVQKSLLPLARKLMSKGQMVTVLATTGYRECQEL